MGGAGAGLVGYLVGGLVVGIGGQLVGCDTGVQARRRQTSGVRLAARPTCARLRLSFPFAFSSQPPRW